ncbi:hypothetical protein NP493_106g00011 [Ridgeia piscesae]|uniref:Secreted protein n=1 Tax=Ridgeia piscesae TaxID=27915 RepID=A0AAD9UHD1_RIDPI|nr:hypothetical protein NP493_106g00011 [Ridgeia piscesae]
MGLLIGASVITLFEAVDACAIAWVSRQRKNTRLRRSSSYSSIAVPTGGRVIARTTNGERTTGNMTCRKVTGEKVTVEKEGGTRGQEMREVDATGGKTNGRKK